MRKIPTIFRRNAENMRLVTDEINPQCQWVFNGEGIATRKYDGTCVLIKDGEYFKRREVKKGKPTPVDFVEVEHDQVTGKKVGWVPVDPTNPSDKYHIEALQSDIKDGTYELLGPKIQGNPENMPVHVLYLHEDAWEYDDVPRSSEGLKNWLKYRDIEGLVFHHEDGRMAKIKKKDFGFLRKDS